MDVKGVLRKAVLPGGLAVAILAGCSLNKEGMGAKTMVTPQPMNSDTENELNADNAYRYSATVDETSTATTEEVTKEPTVQEENAVDKTQVSFEQLMNTMKENDLRRVVSEDAMKLVETFHNQTQKEGNFRLEEDGEVNLDLTYEEAFVLSLLSIHEFIIPAIEGKTAEPATWNKETNIKNTYQVFAHVTGVKIRTANK